jgi:hypothetical protein
MPISGDDKFLLRKVFETGFMTARGWKRRQVTSIKSTKKALGPGQSG